MKLNWGYSIAIIYSLFALTMILFAVKASDQKYDLVNDNYYEQAVNYQQKINAENNSLNSNSKFDIVYLKESNSIKISDSASSSPINGTLTFYKPDKASDDFKLNFSVDTSGNSILPLKTIAHGVWKIFANWKFDSKECYKEVRIYIP